MPTTAELMSRKSAAVPNGVGTKGIYVAKAENSEIWDVEGAGATSILPPGLLCSTRDTGTPL